MSSDAVVAVLAVSQAVTLAALGWTVWALRRARAEARAAAAALSPAAVQYDRAVNAAEWAVRTVVGTAVKVRERGVGNLVMSSIDDLSRWVLEDRDEIVRVTADDGTLTLLFSDIEDSTAHNEALGDVGWVRVLAEHDRLVREQIARHQGHVVKSQGDGFMVAFSAPAEAVAAALDIQAALRHGSRRIRRTPVRVRIGIHCGPVISRDGDYFGRNVAMAARVAAQADGDEVLVTDAIREALQDGTDGAPARPVSFDLAGRVELKGLAGSHDLWSVRRTRPRRREQRDSPRT